MVVTTLREDYGGCFQDRLFEKNILVKSHKKGKISIACLPLELRPSWIMRKWQADRNNLRLFNGNRAIKLNYLFILELRNSPPTPCHKMKEWFGSVFNLSRKKKTCVQIVQLDQVENVGQWGAVRYSEGENSCSDRQCQIQYTPPINIGRARFATVLYC